MENLPNIFPPVKISSPTTARLRREAQTLAEAKLRHLKPSPGQLKDAIDWEYGVLCQAHNAGRVMRYTPQSARGGPVDWMWGFFCGMVAGVVMMAMMIAWWS